MTEVIAVKKAPYVIAWRDGFKVNIPSVDLEHQHLFALIGALDLDSVDQTVEELLEYVVTHFSNEQALMESSGYPAYGEHLKLHEEFGGQVAEFLANDEPWSQERIQELRRYLNKWLIGHIMTHDMRFGKWHESHKAIHIIAPPQQLQPQQQKGLLARLFGGA
jgi:hemerythrin